MTRFDEPVKRAPAMRATGPGIGMGLRLFVARPGITASLLFVTGALLFAGMALVAVREAVPAALNAAFASSPVVVFATPTATKTDVAALGVRLKELPLVADAVLRPKEEAMVALIQAGLPTGSDARNPLPDAWILRVRADDGDHASFVTTATSLRDAAAALPAVDQVRIDARWDERVERWSDHWRRLVRPAVDGSLVAAVVALVGLWVVAADSLKQPTRVGILGESPPKRALALYAILVTGLAGLAATTIGWVAASAIADAADTRGKPWADWAGQSAILIAGAVMLTGCLIGAGTIVLRAQQSPYR